MAASQNSPIFISRAGITVLQLILSGNYSSFSPSSVCYPMVVSDFFPAGK
jgi:hypothetical protein